MSNVSLNQLVYLMREGLGLKQEVLAKKINVDPSTISKFETETLEIKDKVKLFNMADELGIKREFVLGESNYPFYEDRFYKLFTADKVANKPDLFFKLPFFCDYFEATAIIPDLESFVEFLRVRKLKSSVYAIAIRDNHNTIFLLREKNPRSFINISKYLIEDLEPVLKLLPPEQVCKCTSRILSTELDELVPDRDLFVEIMNWTVERETINRLFSPKLSGLQSKR